MEENPELYAAIGDTYGSGPTGFFRIPDLTHRIPLGWGYSDTLGEKGGEEEHNHVENVFAYDGKLAVSNTDIAAQTSKSEIYTVNGTTGFTPVSGTQKGDVYRTEKSSNMPPYLRIKFIIKVKLNGGECMANVIKIKRGSSTNLNSLTLHRRRISNNN